jgi:Tfp pilus assembly protein PilF
MKLLANIVMSLAAIMLLAACSSTLPQTKNSSTSPTLVSGADPTLSARPGQRRRGVSRDVVARFERANASIARQDWPVAISELQWLVRTQTDLSGPCLNLALVYQRTEDLDQAELYFRQALQRNPGNLTAYNQYAIFLRRQGRFSNAESVYLQALGVWEADAATHRNLGVLYDMYMGNQAQALQHFYRYQSLVESEDRVVASWIADLNRQLMTLAQRVRTP